LIQEVFSLLLLVDQLEGSIHPRLWCEWVKSAERRNIVEPSANDSGLGSGYVRLLRLWVRRSPKSKPPLCREAFAPAALRVNPMRVHFFFLLSAAPQGGPALNAAALRHLLVHCLARTLGHFLGNYYLWSERHGRVSAELRALDRSLCVGV
jgi:hypothetical protein